MPRALSILLSPFTHDSRVLRQLGTLSKQGFQTFIFAVHQDGLLLREQHATYELVRVRLMTKPSDKIGLSKALNYGECLVRMISAGVRLKPEIIHANDLKALPIGYVIAKLTGAKLLYDSHELWSEPEWYIESKAFPKWLLNLILRLEKYLAHRADAVVTVSDGIARCMAGKLGIPIPAVIRNVPWVNRWNGVSDPMLLHKTIGVSPTTPIVLHLGSVLPGRALLLISAMRHVPPPAVALFLGEVEDLAVLRNKAEELGIADRIYFHDSVSAYDVCDYASCATVGVSILETQWLNNRYALPNKFFEYLVAGLPVVVNDCSERADVVSAYGVGESFHGSDPRALAASIVAILNDTEKSARYRRQAFCAAKELNWEREELRLLDIYQHLAASAMCVGPRRAAT